MQAKDLLIEVSTGPDTLPEEHSEAKRLSRPTLICLIVVCVAVVLLALLMLNITISYNATLDQLDSYESEYNPVGYCVLLDKDDNVVGLYYNKTVLGLFKQPLPQGLPEITIEYKDLLEYEIVLSPDVLQAIHLYDFPENSLVIIK